MSRHDEQSRADYIIQLDKVYDNIEDMYNEFDRLRLNAIYRGIRKIFIFDKYTSDYEIVSFEVNEPPPTVREHLGYSANNREQYRFKVAVVPVDVVLKYPKIPFCHLLQYENFHFQDSQHLGLKEVDFGDGIINTYLTYKGYSISLAYSQVQGKKKQTHYIGIPYEVIYYWRKLYGKGIQTSLF